MGVRRAILTAGTVMIAAAPSCAAPPPRRVTPPLQSIHVDSNSWGSRLRGWTIDASGRGELEQAPPAWPTDRHLTHRAIAIGPDGFRRVVQALAPAERLATELYRCRPGITDQVYGTVNFRRGGRDTSLNFNLGCDAPRDRELHTALATADRLVDRLIGAVPQMHAIRPPGMLDHPEHTPQ